MWFGGGHSGASSNYSYKFPLTIHSSGRYLVDANGSPFLIHGDSGWTAEVQLNPLQIDAYLNDRQSRGFSAIVMELIERKYSSQTPAYNDQAGNAPFTSMVPNAWTSPNEAYWRIVDYVVNACFIRGMAVIGFPAWMGFGGSGSGEGWLDEINAATAGNLQTYGAFLATRYPQGNMIWAMGGDWSGSSADRAKQWNIATGIRSVKSNVLMTVEPVRTDNSGWVSYGPGGDNLAGYNFNSIYTATTNVAAQCAIEYARSPTTPCFNVEGKYENDPNNVTTVNDQLQQVAQTYLSGAFGYFFGNQRVWAFGAFDNSNNFPGPGPASVFTNGYLLTPGALMMQYVGILMRSNKWWLLVPKVDTSLVSTSLGSGVTQTCPALASDGSFAFIFVNSGASITVVMTNFTHTPVRARWFDATNGVFVAPAEGSSLPNTGSQAFAYPGANSAGYAGWILVID